MASMSFSGGKQMVRPPQRGIFPLDHEAECKPMVQVCHLNRFGSEKYANDTGETFDLVIGNAFFYECLLTLFFFCPLSLLSS